MLFVRSFVESVKEAALFYVVYIDVLFLVNFFMDFIILTVTASILNLRIGCVRRMLGALFGAACYCITLYLPWESRALAGRGMMLISVCIVGIGIFSIRRPGKLFQFLLIFHAAAFFLGGTVTAIYSYTKLGYYIRKAVKGDFYAQICAGILAAIALVSCILGKFIIVCIRQRQREKSLYYEIELIEGKRRKKATALLDTGNDLREPVSGKPVILMDMTFAGELLDERTREEVRGFYKTGTLTETGEEAPRIRLVPYHSVGRSHGLLAAVFLDCLRIQMEQRVIEIPNVCAAFTEEPVSGRGNYQVLLNAGLMNMQGV